MATRHTGGETQGDNDAGSGRSEQGDRTEKGSGKEKRSVKDKILHSKALRRIASRKRGADVTPVKKVQQPSQALPKKMVEVSYASNYIKCAAMYDDPFRRVGDNTTST